MTRSNGFSLIELMVSTLLLSIVTGVVMSGMLGLNNINNVVANRTEMHSGVRNATELLQQEVGQAGRISLPGTVTATATAGASAATLNTTSGLFANQYIVVGAGSLLETVKIASVNSGTSITIDGTFLNTHAASPVAVSGGFAAGVVPPSMADGSTGEVLKLVGDINGDGNMVYVEYTCDTVGERLYRNAMSWDAASKSAPTVEQILLDNIRPNPDGTDCFIYETKTIDATTFVIGVAITLTVRTQERDPITNQFQEETKALLNVSPRNVFNVWQMASLGYDNRVQPLPQQVVQVLLPTLAPEQAE